MDQGSGAKVGDYAKRLDNPVMDGCEFAEAFDKLDYSQKGKTIIVMLISFP